MQKFTRFSSCLLAFTLLLSLLASCTAAADTTTPTSTQEKNISFKIAVLPEQLNGFSIAGQQIVYLVTFANAVDAGGAAVTISAKATGAEVEVINKDIHDGQVAEIIVTPAQASTGKAVELEIAGTRGSVTDTKTTTFDVIEGEDDRQEYALELQARFVKWLAENHPELGITEETVWTGTMVSPQWLVVSHYLFFSDEWEMHIEWHIMIAPDDWSRIDLRRRFKETKPSFAFEISSVTANDAPKPINLPDIIWR